MAGRLRSKIAILQEGETIHAPQSLVDYVVRALLSGLRRGRGERGFHSGCSRAGTLHNSRTDANRNSNSGSNFYLRQF